MSKSQDVSEQSLFCRVWAFPIGSLLDLVGSISEGGPRTRCADRRHLESC